MLTVILCGTSSFFVGSFWIFSDMAFTQRTFSSILLSLCGFSIGILLAQFIRVTLAKSSGYKLVREHPLAPLSNGNFVIVLGSATMDPMVCFRNDGSDVVQFKERLGVAVSIQEENRNDGATEIFKQEIVGGWKYFAIPRHSTKVVLRVPKGSVIR
jgi:hypothetical protein